MVKTILSLFMQNLANKMLKFDTTINFISTIELSKGDVFQQKMKESSDVVIYLI